MKCPMKFNNPCSDIDDQCEGTQCMWYMRANETVGCAVCFAGILANHANSRLDVGIANSKTIPQEE